MLQFFRRHKAATQVAAFSFCLAGLIFLGSAIYYKERNSYEDPRLDEARQHQIQYTQLVEDQEYEQALKVLDMWYQVYNDTPGYQDSFERGVVLNNRGSLFLVQYETELLTMEENGQPLYSYLDAAERSLAEAITLYELWLGRFGTLSQVELKNYAAPYFKADDPAFSARDAGKILERRLESLADAQFETTRRLSVTLTNLGVVKRYKDELEESKALYERALQLWEHNYTAQHNLDMLMGRQPEKRSIISRLFPPDKES